MYINVLTQIWAKAVDQNYIYSVPKELQEQIKVGIRVKISFGKMIIEGFVTEINPKISYDKTKIIKLIDRSMYLYVNNYKYKIGLKKIIDIDDIDLNSDKSIKKLIKKIINYTSKYENNEILNFTNGKWL